MLIPLQSEAAFIEVNFPNFLEESNLAVKYRELTNSEYEKSTDIEIGMKGKNQKLTDLGPYRSLFFNHEL